MRVRLFVMLALSVVSGLCASDGKRRPSTKRAREEVEKVVVAQPQGLGLLDQSRQTGRVSVMQHLAIIPDGNRRWAKANKLESLLGHRKGLDVVKAAMRVCVKNGIPELSIYTFSLENFNRSAAEKTYLFNMIETEFKNSVPELIQEGISVRFLGDEAYYPASLQKAIKEIETKTADGNALQLNLLFCYGGQQEIVHAAKKVAQLVKDGALNVDEITEETLNKFLWTGSLHNPDLIIRTGGEDYQRTSNYFTFKGAYSEWMFPKEYWPAVTEELLQGWIEKFVHIKRNFGK